MPNSTQHCNLTGTGHIHSGISYLKLKLKTQLQSRGPNINCSRVTCDPLHSMAQRLFLASHKVALERATLPCLILCCLFLGFICSFIFSSPVQCTNTGHLGILVCTTFCCMYPKRLQECLILIRC